MTDRDSRKGKRLLAGRPLSASASQTETPPYQYVSVEGPIAGSSAPSSSDTARVLAHRYLGRGGRRPLREGERRGRRRDASIVVQLRPERWLTVDYRKAFGG